MTKILATINIFCLLSLPLSGFAANENLDEKIARKARYATNTYSNLEDPSTYVWQPESLCYIDVETGKEIWVLMHGPDQTAIWSKEYATDGWSFDGSIMGAFIPIADRTSSNPAFVSSGTYKRWLVKTDGSLLKAATGYANEGISEGGFGWAHTENAYYGLGAHSSWDAPVGMLVKNTVDSNNDVVGAQLLNLQQANIDKGYAIETTTFGIIKRPISADDNWISVSSRLEMDRDTTIDAYGHMRVALNKGVSPTIEDYWSTNRDIHEYFDHVLASEYKAHGGANWAWGFDHEYSHIQYVSPDHIWFQLQTTGSSVDGGPLWEDWDGDSYGDDEIDVMTYGDDSRTGDPVPYGGYSHQYWNHPSFDMWEEYMITGLGDTTGAMNELVGPGTSVRKVVDGTGYDGGLGEIVNDLTSGNNQYDGLHHAWGGWTDQVIFFPIYVDDVASGNDTVYARRLHFDTQTKDDAVAVATTHHTYDGNYPGYPRPSQSPDGTKVAFSTIWLNNDIDDHPYISYAVVEYPHPPEIISLTGSGTYTIRFDYRLDQTTSRGYSNRGWPTSSDDKPVPREVNKFRLWRSVDGNTWEPIKTLNATITTKFDLSNGGLVGGQVGHWDFIDTPGAGTFYYAVTAVEHSGLESRVVSNVFSTAGSQTAAYPTDPGIDTGIISSFDLSLVRYYNVYAEDGSAPTVNSINLIVSVPVTFGESFVDWLGNTAGTTQYKVTAVDTQGNESNPYNVTSTHKQAPATADGQYTLTWEVSGTTSVGNAGTTWQLGTTGQVNIQ